MAIDKVTTPAVADDSVTLAKMAPGTDGNIISYDASGNPVAVATGSAGQVLTSAGAGAPPTFAEASGGGITQADILYYSGSNSFSAGSQNTFSSWTRQSQSGYAKIGDGVTESSGVFTLPATGIYFIQLHLYIYAGSDVTYITTNIYGTQNNGSNWTNLASDDTSIKQVVGQTYLSSQQFAQFDCTNTSTHKIYTSSYGTHNYNVGNSTNGSYISFIRLGDT